MKRATHRRNRLRDRSVISIHALVKRATAFRVFVALTRFDFNPRPREEGDSAIKAYHLVAHNFNPRPREEGDAFRVFVALTRFDFNPRPREEGDYKYKKFCRVCSYFNPRPREEGDAIVTGINSKAKGFQSTPS